MVMTLYDLSYLVDHLLVLFWWEKIFIPHTIYPLWFVGYWTTYYSIWLCRGILFFISYEVQRIWSSKSRSMHHYTSLVLSSKYIHSVTSANNFLQTDSQWVIDKTKNVTLVALWGIFWMDHNKFSKLNPLFFECVSTFLKQSNKIMFGDSTCPLILAWFTNSDVQCWSLHETIWAQARQVWGHCD